MLGLHSEESHRVIRYMLYPTTQPRCGHEENVAQALLPSLNRARAAAVRAALLWIGDPG